MASSHNQILPSRLGGDEFVVLVEELSQPDDACGIADRLLVALSEPYHLAGQDVYTTASIGVVTSTHAYASADDVIRDADTAMYEAKAAEVALRRVRPGNGARRSKNVCASKTSCGPPSRTGSFSSSISRLYRSKRGEPGASRRE